MYKKDSDKCRAFALRVVLIIASVVCLFILCSCGAKRTVAVDTDERTDSLGVMTEQVTNVRCDSTDSVIVAITEVHTQNIVEEVVVDVHDTVTEHLDMTVDTLGVVHLTLDRITTHSDNSLLKSAIEQYLRNTHDSVRTQTAATDSTRIDRTDSVAVSRHEQMKKSVAVTTQTWYEWLWNKFGVPFIVILMICAGFYAFRYSRDNSTNT